MGKQMKLYAEKTPCAGAVELLDRYAMGDLPPDRERAMDGHLRECASCKKELKVVSRVIGLVENVERFVPPAGLWKKVELEISRPAAGPWYLGFLSKIPQLPTASGNRLRWSGALRATAAVAAAGLTTFWPHGTPLAEIRPFPVQATQTGVVPYMSQAAEPSLFDPLADQASIGAVMEVSNRSAAGSGSPHHFSIQPAMMGGVE